jgi:hypothetical protein
MHDLGSMLRFLRGLGWMVAIHNDYKLGGEAHTFWLFTHQNGRWIKGEALTDELAVAECIKKTGHNE